jgi:hypothetical protein
MSGFMKVCGALLLVVAVICMAMLKLYSAQMQVWGIGPDVIATLFVGGILSLGLGGVIEALLGKPAFAPTIAKTIKPVEVAEIVAEQPEVKPFGFGRKKADAPEVAAAEPAAAQIAPVAKTIAATSVADTIAALEQAKADIKTAIGGVDNIANPEAETETDEDDISPESAVVAPALEGELYVLEEKIIRGRPARILSDDTVEAETDEGWMRFENLEHLNEYLDSVEEGEA